MQLTKPRVDIFASRLLSLNPLSFGLPVAVPDLAISDADGMDHAVAIEPVVSACPGHDTRVRSIPHVNTFDVCRYSALNLVRFDLILLLLEDWPKVADEPPIFSFVGVQAINKCLKLINDEA